MDTDIKPDEVMGVEEKPARKEDERSSRRDRSRERSRDRSHRDRSRDRRDRDRDSRRKSDFYDERRRRDKDRSRSRSRRRSSSPSRKSRRRSRSRSRSRTRSRSRSRSRDRKRSRDKPVERIPRSLGGPMNAPHEEAVEFAKTSKRENRVYVGNLSYDVKFGDLVEFMKGAGEVAFAEVLITPTGVSKGCGIVEFHNQDDAKRAIRELSETPLLGRPIFIREDREAETRFGATPVPGKMGMALANMGGASGGYPPRPSPVHNGQNPGNQLYVGNLPYQAGWQDLKDLFRASGNIVRADINIGADGRAKGSGTVIFESAKDAQAAIAMYNGFDWYGRTLEVREDRYAGLSGPGSYRGGLGRGGLGGGGLRGGLRGGYRGGGLRGGFGRGGYGGGSAAAAAAAAAGGEGRGFSDNLYADYAGPDQQMAGGAFGNGTGAGYIPTGPAGAFGGYPPQADPSQQIMVRNLPWSTANEDLVELFETTGTVELAEILFDGARSKGCGVVQFAQTDEATTAIAKFSQYMYGGRPLDVRYNDRWHTFTPTAAKGGQVVPMA